MPKPILYLIGAISLIGLIAGSIYWIYDLGGDAREDKLKAKFAKTEAGRLQEIVKLQEDARVALELAEKQIVKDRIVYRDRIKVINQSPADCIIPGDIIWVHAESGLYTGEVGTGEVRRSDLR